MILHLGNLRMHIYFNFELGLYITYLKIIGNKSKFPYIWIRSDEGRIANVILGSLCLLPLVLKVDPTGNKSKSKTNSKYKIHKNSKIFGHEVAKGPQTMGKLAVLKQESLNELTKSTATETRTRPTTYCGQIPLQPIKQPHQPPSSEPPLGSRVGPHEGELPPRSRA
jgi:hypothetical protein